MQDEFIYTPPTPLVIGFNPPLKSGAGELKEISLGEPTGAQVQFAEQHLVARNGAAGTRMYQKALLGKLTKLPDSVVADLPMRVFTQAADFVQTFVNAGTEDVWAGEDERPDAFTINFDPPLRINDMDYPSLKFIEPNLGKMMQADKILGDMSPQRVRAFQQQLVTSACGESGAMTMQLPISVINRAATFLMGFTTSAPAT